MTRRITESQLRKIIAEAAQKILNEDNRSPLTDNPGGVENDRVRAKGFTAQFHVPGKRWGDSHEHHNDSTYDVIRKYNGGLNAKKTLTQLLVRAVDLEDEMAAKEFFRVLSKVKPLYRSVYDVIMKHNGGLNAKKTLTQLLVRAVDFEDEMAAKEFFRVLSKVKPLYRAVFGATMRYAEGIEKD